MTRKPTLPHGVSFWSLASMLALLQFAAATPSPMYAIYQQQWHFSALMLTAVYASNALALLGTMLVVGSLSDVLGRRPVLVTAAVVELVSLLTFVNARGVSWLFAARILQGIATGMAAGAISPMMIDLQPEGSGLGALMTNVSSTGGIALGAFGAGLLIQWAPAPTQLVYWLLTAAFCAIVLLVVAMPETVAHQDDRHVSLRPRVGLPTEVRGAYLALLPSIVAAWAFGGLYLSLGPSIVASLTHSSSHFVGGLVILALNGTGAVMAVVGRKWSADQAVYGGAVLLVVGVVLSMVGLDGGLTWLFFVGTAIAGAGFGPSFSGALRTITGLAPAERRAEVVTAIYVASYLGLSLPAIAAGVVVTSVGLFTTAYSYGVAVVVLVVGATVASLLHRQRRGQSAQQQPLAEHHKQAPCPGGVPALSRH